ncbi:hypothetical protein M3Y95_00177200 [Aphelenchoides besseyi]|nr:hypothetical protein M3Y95_00177200 [Aphelenchoides besseyi]
MSQKFSVNRKCSLIYSETSNDASRPKSSVGFAETRHLPSSKRLKTKRRHQLNDKKIEQEQAVDREYLIKLICLQKALRALVVHNSALSDEVARLRTQISICKEEERLIVRRVQHHERNRIRRLQAREKKTLILTTTK